MHFCEFKLQHLFRAGLLLALMLTLSACSQFSTLLNNKPGKVESLIANEQFYGALDLIDATPESDPDYQAVYALRKKVLTAIEDYERTSLARADDLAKQSQLKQALDLVDHALERLPASKALTEKRRNLKRSLHSKLYQTEVKLAEHRADLLPREISLLNELKKYSDDDSIDSALAYRMRDAETTRSILMDQTKSLIDQSQWISARRYAELADKLKSDKETRTLLAKIDGNVLNQHLANLRKAIDDEDLMRARKLTAGLDTKEPRVREQIDRLNAKISEMVVKLSRDGQNAYTKGDLDLAIQQWEKALLLSPENEDIKNQLQRAKTFKKNYQRFKSS